MVGESSMDDILASIRKMISEEPNAVRGPATAPQRSAAPPQSAPPQAGPSLDPVATAWGQAPAARTFGPAIGPQAGALPRVDPDRNAAFPIAKDNLSALIDDTAAKPAVPLVRPQPSMQQAATPQPPAQQASVTSAPFTSPQSTTAQLILPEAPFNGMGQPTLTDRLLERFGAATGTLAPATAAPSLSIPSAPRPQPLTIDRPPVFDGDLGAPGDQRSPSDQTSSEPLAAKAPNLGAVRPEPTLAEPTLAALLAGEPTVPLPSAAYSPVVGTPKLDGPKLDAPKIDMAAEPSLPMPSLPIPAALAAQPSEHAILSAALPKTGTSGTGAPSSGSSIGARTMEDAVAEMLRPMLQSWIDQNLPRIVEQIARETFAASHLNDKTS